MRDEQQEVLGRAQASPSGVETELPATPTTPTDPALEAAERYFDAGNFREARCSADEALRSESEEVRSAARDLIDALRPDPAAMWIVAGCTALFVVVVWLTLF